MSFVRLIVMMLALLVVAPAASAQTGPQAYHGTRVATELDEKVEPQNVPAPYGGPPLTLQQSYVGREAAEPTIGVDGDGVAFYAAGAFDGFGLPGALARTEIWRSLDGGLTFHKSSPEILGEDIPPTTLDPYVYVDAKTGRVFSIDLAGAGSYIAYSDDKGETWGTTAMSSPGVNDHQSFSTAPPPDDFPLAQTSDAFPNLIWYCVNHVSDSRCSYSADGGDSFLPGATAPYNPTDSCPGGLHGHLEGGPDGTIFLPAGRCGTPSVAFSNNAATTWTEVAVSENIPSSVPHTGLAVDAEGNAFYVFHDDVHKLPWLSTSTDGGESWSTPLMIAPPGVKAVNFPEIVAGDAGRIAVIFPGTAFNDSEDEPNSDRPWNYYMVVSTNALDPNPLFVSNIANDPNDPLHRGNCDGRCAGMFDFFEVTVSPHDGSTWASATDTCLSDTGCADPDGVAGMASDAQGVAVRQLGGPWLVGATPRGSVPAGTPTVPAPAGTVDPRPVAPSARRAGVRCGKRRGKTLRCVVSVRNAPGGARVGLSLLRGRRVLARGSGPVRAGRAVVRVRGRRGIRSGTYRLRVSISFRGATPSVASRRLRLR